MSPASAAAPIGRPMQFAFDSCLSECDCGIDRRPYHKNCGCALHKSNSKGYLLKGTESSGLKNKVAFPIRRSWSEGCLAAVMTSGNSSPVSGTSSPGKVEVMGRRKASMNRLMDLCVEEDENEASQR